MSASGLAERLRIRVRPDLIVRPQLYEGRTYYVVKDPVGMRYFRFREEEYFLIGRLDGKRGLEEIKEDYERQFRPQKITIEELARFASQLAQAGVAHVDASRQGQILYQRYRKTLVKKRMAQWSNILYIKLPGFDPDKILTRMEPYFRWVYHRAVVAGTILLWLIACVWLASHYDTFRARLPEFDAFFNWHNALYFWVALAAVKVIHEFGHGLTCKYYRGECHEMGLLFLVLSPCLYCDVSDSWLLPNKWHRVWIAAAGIYVELTIAAIATFFWWNTEPGLLNNLCLSSMFICSVNTIMFNANPLLRFDGYYAMMDMLEIPNLRAKSTRFFQNLFGKVCLGLPTEMDTYLPRSRRVFFFIFALASYLYRWFISIVILWFLYQFLRPYKLGTISALLAVGALVSLLVLPSYQLGKFVWEYRRTSAVSKWRISCTLAVLGIVVLFALLVPLPVTVETGFLLMPQNPEYVWVGEIEGVLENQEIEDGDWVEDGESLATLRNRAKEQELHNAMSLARQHRVQADGLRLAGEEDKVSMEEQLAEQWEGTAQNLQQSLDSLHLVAQRSGMVMQPPKREQLGSLLEPGTPFCVIGDPRKLEARLVVDQADTDLIERGQSADLKFYSHPLDTTEGTVTNIAEVDVERLPRELSNLAGGEVATKTDPDTGQEKPIHTVYHAVVPLENPDGILQPGMRGRAKIAARKLTLARRVWRWITRNFHFEV